MNIKIRLTILSFLQFAVWGAYLTSMGAYLVSAQLSDYISWFYAMQGVVSILMPALMGIVADRWIQAQKVLSMCHALAGVFMSLACIYGYTSVGHVSFTVLFSLYSLSVAFYMPTIALSNSVAYSALTNAGYNTVKTFPPIRVFGTIGFIVAMLVVDWTGLQGVPGQFGLSGIISLIMALYALTMPSCPVDKTKQAKGLVELLGLNAFTLFREKKMAIFFIFSMFLGASLQITNGYANPFISSFGSDEAYADTFGVLHANTLISLSQVSETICILLIPFFLRRFGIKVVMLISMFAWVFRFGFFAIGNPGMPGVLLFVLSMIVYGVAFDFFNISGSLFVDKETNTDIRSSAQGLFMMMTNGLGASIGTLVAGEVVIKQFTHEEKIDGIVYRVGDWGACWAIFAFYAFIIGILFAILFRYKHVVEKN